MAHDIAKAECRILIVEDNPGDAVLLKRALNREDPNLDIIVEPSAEEAVKLIEKRVGQSKLMPNLIILDINLPGQNGIEFLKGAKANIDLSYIPIIMMSTSDNRAEVLEAYSNGAAGFIRKPMESGLYAHVAKCLTTCWLQLMELPHRDALSKDAHKFARLR